MELHSFTSQADCFKESDPSAWSEVEEIVLRVLYDGLALVPVVVHVEALAVGVGLAPAGTLPTDPSLPPTVKTFWSGSDQLVTCNIK